MRPIFVKEKYIIGDQEKLDNDKILIRFISIDNANSFSIIFLQEDYNEIIGNKEHYFFGKVNFLNLPLYIEYKYIDSQIFAIQVFLGKIINGEMKYSNVDIK